MPDTLNTAADTLSDENRRFEIAIHYANGDAERAKQILAGTLKDVYVIKGKFNSTTARCGFIAFFNYNLLMLNSVYPVFSSASVHKDLEVNANWSAFEKNLTDLANNKDNDEVLSRQFNSAFTKAFTYQFSVDFKKRIDAKDEIAINRFFMQFVRDRIGFQSVDIRVDCEFISSLDMELNSLTSRKIVENKDHAVEQTKSVEPEIEFEGEDDRDFFNDKDVKVVLQGSLILSPVSGRDVRLLIQGDRIKIKIVDLHPKAIQVARAFNAYDEGGFLPITGRIASIRRRAEGGYKIFVIIAKGIYVKIEETEENIKIAIDTSFMASKSGVDKISKVSYVIIAILSIIVLALFAVILYVIK